GTGILRGKSKELSTGQWFWCYHEKLIVLVFLLLNEGQWQIIFIRYAFHPQRRIQIQWNHSNRIRQHKNGRRCCAFQVTASFNSYAHLFIGQPIGRIPLPSRRHSLRVLIRVMKGSPYTSLIVVVGRESNLFRCQWESEKVSWNSMRIQNVDLLPAVFFAFDKGTEKISGLGVQYVFENRRIQVVLDIFSQCLPE